jgi:hypothetical protein
VPPAPARQILAQNPERGQPLYSLTNPGDSERHRKNCAIIFGALAKLSICRNISLDKSIRYWFNLDRPALLGINKFEIILKIYPQNHLSLTG